jgi:tetratricopeptide (TPR) repeat protein
MKTPATLIRTLGIVACAAALSACFTKPLALPKPQLQDMLSQASRAAGSGQKEQAVKLWEETAAVYPADKTPWANIAQTRYDAGQYGEAIVAAQEVLVRDPNDKLANSIIAIGGLRLSIRAIADLSRQNKLAGPLRAESQDLAKLLRESLGETVLLPVTPAKVEGDAPTRIRVKKPLKVPRPGDASADPFSILN